jgi:hypothetical protein
VANRNDPFLIALHALEYNNRINEDEHCSLLTLLERHDQIVAKNLFKTFWWYLILGILGILMIVSQIAFVLFDENVHWWDWALLVFWFVITPVTFAFAFATRRNADRLQEFVDNTDVPEVD